MMVMPVQTDPSFEWETPKVLFKSQYPSAGLDAGHRYSCNPDGQRFLMINDITAIGGATPQINIVVNWFEELKERIPVD